MSWFLVIMFLSVTFGDISDATSHDKKPPSAVVVGTVYCDTCFQQDFPMGKHFISGASVAVECKDKQESSEPRFRKEVKTNEKGEFRVNLPFSVSKHVRKIKGCVVKLVSSSEPYCAVASTATSSSLHLKSRKQGLHIFSAGFFSFKPLKQPNLCNQKPSIDQKNTNNFGSVKNFPHNIDPSFPPPLQDPNPPGGVLPFLPAIPILPPLPQLPTLPNLPGIPIPSSSPKLVPSNSNNAKISSDQKVVNPETFPPNPFFPPPIVPNPFQPPTSVPNPLQPPSSPVIPNPFQPPSPPPLIPNPLQPPPSSGPSPSFPFPTVPGFSPFPSPPSPPPGFPFPFRPVFPPPGGNPGTPPSSQKASP